MQRPAFAGPFGRVVAWLGGGVFVASLALFGWCYAVRYSAHSNAGRPWVAPLVADLLLFTVFALHHSVMARTRAKDWLTRLVPAPLERTLYVWIGSLLFAWTCLAWREIPVLLYQLTAPWKAVAVTVQIAGAYLTLHAAGVIDVLELAGIKQAMGWTTRPEFKVIGPYHLVRHPIYLGWILITFGTPTMTGTKLAFAVISTAYLAVAVPFEERSLVDVFGEEYRSYQRRVRWRMVPGVY